MALYEELCSIDVLGPIKGILRQPPFTLGTPEDLGKIQLIRVMTPDTPWLHAKMCQERRCGKWHQMYFKYYGIIPKGCRYCWKIVWTGSTLDQLFKVREIQLEMELESKCGVETRGYSGKLGYYQGFWYCPMDTGLEGARKQWKEIVDRFSKEPLLGASDIILKRGCTEMERAFSPSDAWDEIAKQGVWDQRERLLDTLFIDPPNVLEPGPIRTSVQIRWIEWAWENKDPVVTSKYPNRYLEAPLSPPAMQYQKSIHSNVDYGGWEGHGTPINNDKRSLITEL